MKLSQVQKILFNLGYQTELIKDADFSVLGPERNPSNKSLRFLMEIKYLDAQIIQSSALLINKNLNIDKLLNFYNGGILQCEDSRECFYAIHDYLFKNTNFFGESINSQIDSSVKVGRNVNISDKNVVIGKNVMIGDNVVIGSNVKIGNNVRIDAGTIIGAESVQLVNLKGKKQILPHAGEVIIGDDVIIMNNCIISKGITPWYSTIICKDVVLGNGVIIAHGTLIGKGTLILDNSTIAGHCSIGENTWIGAQTVTRNRIKIGSNVHISPGSTIIENIPNDMSVSGFFAVEREKSLKYYQRLKLGKI